MLEHLINLVKKILETTPTNTTSNNHNNLSSNKESKQKLTQSFTFNQDERQQNIIEKLQAFAERTLPQNWSPSRFIYKVGALNVPNIFPYLKQIAQQESALLNKDENFKYSLIWTLGRSGDSRALSLIDKMIEEEAPNYIKRLTIDACLHLATNEKDQLLTILKDALPKNTIELLKQPATTSLSKAQITTFFLEEAGQEMPPLFSCYLLSFEQKELRPYLINILRKLPLIYPYFQTVRFIYKSAIFRDDYEMLGLLSYRMDTEVATYNVVYDWNWDRKNQKSYWTKRAQVKKAFSNKTKAYFQRKTVRQLLFLGEQGLESYCRYATALLKEYQIEEIAPKVENRYYYSRQERKYIESTVNVIPQNCAAWLSMNNEDTVVKRLFLGSSVTIPAADYERLYKNRTEPFADIWDEYPQYALDLLLTCKNEYIANFAAKILKHSDREAELITRTICLQLIKSPLDTVANYTLGHIQKFLKPNEPDWEIIQSLVQAPNEKFRNYLLTTIENNPTVFYTQAELLENIVLSLYPDIAAWFQKNATQFNLSENKKTPIFNALLKKIQLQKTEDKAEILYANSLLFFGQQIRKASVAQATELLKHPLEKVQLLGAEILCSKKDQIEQIPEATIMDMMAANYVSIRQRGMELFGAMPVELLLERKDILISMAISKEPEMREAVQPIIAKTAKGKPE